MTYKTSPITIAIESRIQEYIYISFTFPVSILFLLPAFPYVGINSLSTEGLSIQTSQLNIIHSRKTKQKVIFNTMYPYSILMEVP